MTDDGDGLSLPARRLKLVDEKVFKFESFLNLIAALVILGVMMLGVIQIFSRKLLNLPIPAFIDITEIVMTLFAFIGIAYTQRVGGHIRMEVLIGRFKGRLLFTFEVFALVLAFVVIAVLIWYSYGHFLRAYEVGDTTMDAEFPLWPSKLVVPISLFILEIRIAIEFVGFVRLWLYPQAPPVAVPHIESVDEVAQRELDAALAAEADKVDLLGRNRPKVS